jgi:hypothetical protein
MDRKADKQTRQIQRQTTSWPRSRARKPGAFLFPINACEGPATAAAGERPLPTTPIQAQEPCGVCSAGSRKGEQLIELTAIGLLQGCDVLPPEG